MRPVELGRLAIASSSSCWSLVGETSTCAASRGSASLAVPAKSVMPILGDALSSVRLKSCTKSDANCEMSSWTDAMDAEASRRSMKS